MKDINFFKPYLGKNKEKINTNIYTYGIISISTLLIIITFALNTIKIFTLNKSIESYNDKLSAPQIQTQLKEVESINKQIDLLNQYESALTNVVVSVKDRDNVSDSLLSAISSTLPSEVSFDSFSISNNTIAISGVSKNRTAIAELQYNLKKLSIMSDVYVNSIDTQSAVDGEYSFDIKCVLKGVM
jgi:type IV pilus assembly protein PilN